MRFCYKEKKYETQRRLKNKEFYLNEKFIKLLLNFFSKNILKIAKKAVQGRKK